MGLPVIPVPLLPVVFRSPLAPLPLLLQLGPPPIPSPSLSYLTSTVTPGYPPKLGLALDTEFLLLPDELALGVMNELVEEGDWEEEEG